MKEAKPIQYNIHVENMRNKHIELMRKNRHLYGRARTVEERVLLKEEYKRMKKDLIEFDSWFLDTKFKEFDPENENTKSVYVCMETGMGYYSKDEAIKVSGLKKGKFEEKLISPTSPNECNWRLFQESLITC